MVDNFNLNIRFIEKNINICHLLCFHNCILIRKKHLVAFSKINNPAKMIFSSKSYRKNISTGWGINESCSEDISTGENLPHLKYI